MKRFKETTADLHETNQQSKLALDLAILDEADDMCSVPLEKLKSRVMRDRHKKICKGDDHSSTTKKKSKKSMWSKAAHKAAGGRHKLYNNYAEGIEDNLVVLIRDITSQMIGAIKKGDERKLKGLYKNLGKVIK